MMKKNINKLGNIIIVLVSVFVSISRVDASIKEVTDAGNASFDHITTGQKIIGNSKFSSSTVLTGRRVSVATKNSLDYDSSLSVEIYYYLGNNIWYVFDDDNNPSRVADQAILNSLNERKIFYVDNVEKKISIPYTQVNETPIFTTNDNEKTKSITYTGNAIMVPATVKNLTVKDGNLTNTFVKTDSEEGFVKNPLRGVIASADDNLTAFPSKETLMFQGTIPYRISTDELVPSGNYASIKIRTEDNSRPDEAVREQIKFVVKDANNPEGKEVTWGIDNDSPSRTFDLMFSESMREASIEVAWPLENGETLTQEFRVSLFDSVELKERPNGRIQWDFTNGGDYEYDLEDADRIILRTNSDGVFGVYIFPHDDYEVNADFENSVDVEIVGSEESYTQTLRWENHFMYKTKRAIHYVTRVTENNSLIKINVTWQDGFTQEFIIDASGIYGE